mgnify:FL=1
MKVFVKAKPNSKVPKIEKIDAEHFTVAVRERPKDGQANIAIQEVIADYFKVAPSRVRLVSGFSSKNKIFEIE